ncbi:Delta 8 Fatty Acid Desaturase [Orobanche gracilis]
MADEDKKIYITSDELKKHNKPDDLWLSIQGKIYNVTDWLKDHPGGDIPILNLAGQDVTDAFIAFHPGSAWKHLDKFFTGFYLEDFQVSEVSRDYRTLVSQFVKSGLFEKKGHGVIYSLCFISLLFSACVYGVLRTDSFWSHMLSGAVLGLAWMQVTYLGHDSGHYNIMLTPGYNRLAQIMAGNCLTGISIAWWKWTHNAHHVACNSLDHDPDLQHLPVFAVSSRLFQSLTSQFYKRKLTFDSLSRFFVSYQHLTFYPVMVVARLNLYLQTILLLLSTNFTVCSIQHIQFCLNHFAANVYVGAPKGNDWFEKQTSGTIDISCSSWMDWFFGGLQFQLEHHLFPRLPRCQLRNISPVVQELCKKHNLPYNSVSFFEANKWTLRTLRSAALEARDLSSPVPKNLIWEAVNTHG